MPDLLGAVNDFLLTFEPGAEQARLIRGYFNHGALPPAPRYTLFAVSGSENIGTPTLDFSDADATVSALRRYDVDCDFVSSEQEDARGRAAAVQNAASCYFGTRFFAGQGLALDWADALDYLPYVDESERYVHRYRVTLHISFWEPTSMLQDSASRLAFARIENVDAHHPPKGEIL